MTASNRQKQLTGNIEPEPEVEEFANALDNCLARGLTVSEKRARILDLPRKYHENAIRRLAHKRPNRAKPGADDMDMDVDADADADADADKHRSDGDSSKESDELRQLEKEVETWDLFRRLLPLRYSASDGGLMRFSSPFPAAKKSIHDHVHDFLETNSLAMERRAVLQWLQTTAAAGPDIDELARELQQNADRGDIIAHGWLHTRSKIKLRKGVMMWPHLLERQSPNVTASHVNSDGAPLVTHLDPDASTRQGRKLEPQDDYFERAIWLGCFEHLRRGSNLEDIREWCQERTEMWRAMSMSAMPMSVDDRQDSETGADPASLALWRRMCLSLARQGGSDDLERAVYGILSGDIVAVEKVARTWDDYLFANYNALLRSQIDTYMLSKCPPEVVSTLAQSFPAFDAVQFLGDADSVEKRLIQTIGSNPRVQAEASEPNKALQASFIANELDRHLYEQGLVITAAANEFSKSRLVRRGLEEDEDESSVAKHKYFDLAHHSGLRIAAHVFVLVSLLNRFETHESGSSQQETRADWRFSQENILAAYTDYLRRCKLQELIPLYCSVLDTPRCHEVLSWNVIEESEPSKRLTQLKLIRQAGIDVPTFVETQANLFFGELDSDPNQAVTAHSFRILEAGPPASRVKRRIKLDFFGDEEDAIDRKDMLVIWALEWLLTVEETWPKVFSIGTKVYKFFLGNGRLGAARRLFRKVAFGGIMQHMVGPEEPEVVLYDDVVFWSQQLERSGIRNVRPEQVMSDARNYMELEALVKALDNLETIASCAAISEDERPDTANKEFWHRIGDEVKAAKDNMQPLLRGWLMAGIEDGDDELKQLRQAYLPETILAYVSALHFAGTGISRDYLLECMELASVVAERNSDVAAAFVDAGRMTELVEAFTACSKSLAIATEEKRAAGFGGRKLRELGWSRDVWAVKK
ncbi:hypothetical protein E4U42_006188 [Claviceps africana]|uniref:Nuclear pore complex protein n=1 Tax=Claviceps africana TaxID=83212 RepID=A0A8K0NL46_9HYPO|nr:hypothetical protein E4U42_006188 [Claviceps africana]